MKIALTLALGLSLGLSGISCADGFGGTSATLYYQLPLGGATHHQPSYGLALVNQARYDDLGSIQPLRQRLMDFRFQDRRLQNVKLNGVTLLSRDPQSHQLNVGGTEISTTGMLVIGGLATAGILCAAEKIICKNSSSPAPANNPPPNQGGLGLF